MIFRQLFDEASCTYTYLIGDTSCDTSYNNREALIIDPVLNKTGLYMQLLEELELQLVYAIDTHVYADHITAIGKLRELTGCETVHGEHSKARGITINVADGDTLSIGTLHLNTLYTPGHTDDSYCFLMQHETRQLLFSGDTLLIRGTGRTDFQQGNADQQYQSLFNKLLRLDDDTLVYPGHDYKGVTVSTIGEERKFNPRLQVHDQREYRSIMSNLNLDPPKQIDVAVPANLLCGL